MSDVTGYEPRPDDVYAVDSGYEVANWRPLVNWVLTIPHLFIVRVLQTVANVVFFVYWVVLIFTGRLNPGMYRLLAMCQRYELRTTSFLFGFTENYPPFDFTMGGDDDGEHDEVRVTLPEPGESTPRTAAFNVFLAIPHYLFIVILVIVAAIVLLVGWFAALFTGSWPAAMRDWLIRFGNYYMRVWQYAVMVETKYPKFGL